MKRSANLIRWLLEHIEGKTTMQMSTLPKPPNGYTAEFVTPHEVACCSEVS